MYGAKNFIGTMILVISPGSVKVLMSTLTYRRERRASCGPGRINNEYEYDFRIGVFSNTGHFPMFQVCVKRGLNYNFASSFYPLRQSLVLTSQIIVMVFFSKLTISLFALQFFAVQGFPAESRSDEINIFPVFRKTAPARFKFLASEQ
ncbi:hypothetical protein C8J55DRAFT_552542 [Lentinula edodes]|uniref:Uncharacterized protein n=1 Tax=Lentinula lateritia TaxID=40482 RepID=A0A9W9DEU9_9AGAR|nr:hypothetical protein C8J55DRAFT_552542 [Lentinula edodes]